MDYASADERLEIHFERCLLRYGNKEVYEAAFRNDAQQWPALQGRIRGKTEKDVRRSVRGRNFQSVNIWLAELQETTIEKARIRLDEFRETRPHSLPMKEQLNRDEWLIDTMCCWAGDTVVTSAARADAHRLVDSGRVNKLRKDLTTEVKSLLAKAMGDPIGPPSVRANMRPPPSSRRRPTEGSGKLKDIAGANDPNEEKTIFTVADVRAVFSDSDFRMRLLQRLREPAREVQQVSTPRCARCHACLQPQAVLGECRYHPGEWISNAQGTTPEKKWKGWLKWRKSRPADYQVAVSAGARWSCCDSAIESSPGCVPAMHVRPLSYRETSETVEVCD